MECDKVSFVMSRADVEYQRLIELYPIHQLVEELSLQAPRFQSSGGMDGMAWLARPPRRRGF
jgi:hypothetical protein